MDEAEWQSHPAPLPAAVLSGSQQDRAEVAGPARGCHAEPPLHDYRATRGQRSTVAKRSQPRIPATAAPLGRLTMVPPTLFAQGHLVSVPGRAGRAFRAKETFKSQCLRRSPRPPPSPAGAARISPAARRRVLAAGRFFPDWTIP